MLRPRAVARGIGEVRVECASLGRLMKKRSEFGGAWGHEIVSGGDKLARTSTKTGRKPPASPPRAVALGMGLCVALSSLSAARAGHADEAKARTSSLSWVRLEGAESCIATQALARAVEERLARKVFVSAAEADVSVEGHLSKTGDQWKAVLTIRDSEGTLLGTRTLDSKEAECSALDEGLVFVVSVLIDPDAALAEPKPEKAEPSDPLPEPKPPRVVVRRERVLVPVTPLSLPPEPWRVGFSALLTGALGLLPGPALGVGAAVLLDSPGFLDIDLKATYWFPRTADAERGASAELSLLHAGAALCPLAFKRGTFSYHFCGGLLLGALRSRGTGFDAQQSDNAPSVYLQLPSRVSLGLAGPLALTASVSFLAPLVRSEVTYRAANGSDQTLFEPSPVAVSGGVGLTLLFPSP